MNNENKNNNAMLRLTVKDYYEKPEESNTPETFKMREAKEITYRNDELKLWRLKDEVKTLTYLQQSATPEDWIKHQRRIEELEFRILSIFSWKKRNATQKKATKYIDKNI